MATTEQTDSLNFKILKKSTLLYIEDDEIIRKETLSVFEKFFKKVHVGEDGKIGLDKYKSHKDEIDIILTDLSMPNMDGLEFMAEVRKVDLDIPILIVTAFNDMTQLIKAIKFKVSDYIVKPIQLNTTLKILNKTLEVNYNLKLVNKQQNELQSYKDILDKENLVSETDLEGIITYVNDIFCEVSGYTREELVGSNHNIVRHPDVSPKMFEKLWETIKSGHTWNGKIKNKTKDGEAYYVKSTIFPILDNDGNIEKYVGSRFLITEDEEEKHKLKKYIMHQKSQQIKHDKALNEKYEEALSLAKLQKDEQVANFVHELNDQIKTLRTRSSDDKGRILSLERKLKEAVTKSEKLQVGYQSRMETLHQTAVSAVGEYEKIKKKDIFLFTKFEESQKGIKNLQGYIDEYRKKIEDLEDVLSAYEKQFGPLTAK